MFGMKRKEPAYDPKRFIEANRLSMKNPLGQAFSDVSCVIPQGSLVAVRADHGHGKTPFLLTLAGRMIPTSGTLSVAGYEIPAQRNKVARIAGLGLFEGLNDLEENLTAASFLKAEMDVYDKPVRRDYIRSYMDEYGLSHLGKERVRDYERIDLVRLGIALGMAGDPKLLLVDDVEDQLTSSQTAQILVELRDIAHGRNVAVVFACTDEDVAREADLVVDLQKGGN